MSDIDIAICTFRRPQVIYTLRSIAQLHLPLDTNIRVIVADNDDAPSARERIENAAQEYGLSLVYIHAPARNISVARNACLDTATAPLLAFIDDDEQVSANWLSSLLNTMQSSDADIVLGPVIAQYEANAPGWMRRGDFHSTTPVWVNGRIISGYSCNVLINRLSPPLQGVRFRLDLGQSGGEDAFYFSEAYKAGAQFAYAPDAVVTEPIPPERATLGWLIKRRFRFGQTHGLWLRETSDNWLLNITKAKLKMIACFLAMLANPFCTERRIYWLLRGTLHVGVICSLIGIRTIQSYGKN